MGKHDVLKKYQGAISEAVGIALDEQPWLARRKNTIVAIAGGVVQLAGFAGVFLDKLPASIGLTVGVLVLIAQACLQAGMRGAITPSMVERIAEAGAKVNPETVVRVYGAEVVAEALKTAGLPVYSGDSTAPDIAVAQRFRG